MRALLYSMPLLFLAGAPLAAQERVAVKGGKIIRNDLTTSAVSSR